MLFALESITQEARDLGAMGAQALLGVAVLALTSTVVVLFRVWRADMKEKRTEFVNEINVLAGKHEDAEQRWRDEMRQQRVEFTGALKEISDTVRLTAAESRANTAAILNRLDRLETHLPERH